jgi:hypothetical protein
VHRVLVVMAVTVLAVIVPVRVRSIRLRCGAEVAAVGAVVVPV